MFLFYLPLLKAEHLETFDLETCGVKYVDVLSDTAHKQV